MKVFTVYGLRFTMSRRILLTLCIVHFASCIAFAQFTASVSSNTVAVGEQFQVDFQLQGNGKNFQAPTFDGFNVLMGPNQSTSMSIMNGSVSQSLTLTYVLEPTREGTFKIGSASIESGGKRISSNPLTLTVVKGSSQAQAQSGNQQSNKEGTMAGGKNVFLKASIDKTNVYQGEAIAVTYRLYTKVTLVNYAISKMPSFNGFWSQEITLPQQLEFRVENFDGVNYKVADVKKMILFPQRAGALSLDAMEGEVIARVQTKQQRSNDPFANDPFFNQFFGGNVQDVKVAMKSESVKINVRELPTNAPSTFTGAVGKFTMETTLDKTEIKAHDGVTLKIKVTGKGNLKLIDAPKINFPPDFETYDPKVNSNVTANGGGVTGTKTFEYLVIPRNAGEYKIPVEGFTFFDLEKNQYVTLEGKEFVLHVGRGEESASTVVSGVNKSDIQFLGRDIRYIKTKTPEFIQPNENFYSSPLFYSILGAPALLFAMLLVFRRRYEEMQSNVSLLKSRAANKVARKRLSAAKKFLDEKKREQFLDEMFRAQWGFVSDKLAIPVSELTKENIASVLNSKNVTQDSTEQFIKTLDACELARFAPGAAESIEEIYQKGIATISKIEEEIK